MTSSDPNAQQGEWNPTAIRGWLEFCCWTTLALAPFLYWVNGPAVSTDQLVVRTALVVIAAVGAIGLRLCAWRWKAVAAAHRKAGGDDPAN